jgi:hypothetical protein
MLYLWSPTNNTKRLETETLLAPILPVTAVPCVRRVVFYVPLREHKSFCGSRCVGMSNHLVVCHTVLSLRISFAGRLPRTYALRYVSVYLKTFQWCQDTRYLEYALTIQLGPVLLVCV